ncbi:MAG TPA: ABC transporter ATP-binding protein [Burkholderiaceae bacterium]|nr:ABC transporter ATP-binding protein [Burkholderiaceae bacterium]
MNAPMVVELRGVTLRVSNRVLVDALSLTLRVGERWAVLGPNGAGKSTLLGAIAGARPLDAGEVVFGDRSVLRLRADELARCRALLTDRWLDPFSSTALDTVLTARYVFRDEDAAAPIARDWLGRLDCAALADRDVRRLSRGERQRVAIATTLAQDTPLVLLDEPTAHQDPRHQAHVIRELCALGNRTLVASLHDLNAAARFATHALLLWGDGRTLAGPAQQVLTAAALSELFATPISRARFGDEEFFHVHGGDPVRAPVPEEGGRPEDQQRF